MSAEATPKLALPFLAPAQAQKHVTLNDALMRLDLLVQLSVKHDQVTEQPADPAEGDAYILPVGATGLAWSAMDPGDIAAYWSGAWSRIQPRDGWLAYVEGRGDLMGHGSGVWFSLISPTSELQNLARLGVGTAADGANPFLAKLNTALWTALRVAEGGSGDLRYTLNKEASGNVLSLLFQTGFSGRAEVGLAGDDALRLRASADGSSWVDAVSITEGGAKVGLGERAPRYSAHLAGTVGFTPAAAEPAEPGDVTLTLNGDAQIVFKARGQDGVVRSRALNLV